MSSRIRTSINASTAEKAVGEACISYRAQRFHQGDWVTAEEGMDRDSLIKWAHCRAMESEAPPMRVIEITWAGGSPVEDVIYRSWHPQDWPTNYQLFMWWNIIRKKERAMSRE